MKNLLKANARAGSKVRTAAEWVCVILRRATRGFQRKMPQHSRGLLLSMRPTNAVGAEIGVHEADFSRRILDVLKPRKMHLIDPWQYQTGKEFAEAYYGGKAKGRPN